MMGIPIEVFKDDKGDFRASCWQARTFVFPSLVQWVFHDCIWASVQWDALRVYFSCMHGWGRPIDKRGRRGERTWLLSTLHSSYKRTPTSWWPHREYHWGICWYKISYLPTGCSINDICLLDSLQQPILKQCMSTSVRRIDLAGQRRNLVSRALRLCVGLIRSIVACRSHASTKVSATHELRYIGSWSTKLHCLKHLGYAALVGYLTCRWVHASETSFAFERQFQRSSHQYFEEPLRHKIIHVELALLMSAGRS